MRATNILWSVVTIIVFVVMIIFIYYKWSSIQLSTCIESGKNKIPIVRELVKKYPKTKISVSYFKGDSPKKLNAEVIIDGKYEVTVQAVITYDFWGDIKSINNLEVFFLKIKHINGRKITYDDLQRKFSADEIKALSSGFELEKIGISDE